MKWQLSLYIYMGWGSLGLIVVDPALVVSEPHRSLNSSKGTLYSVEYASWNVEGILWELQAHGVSVSNVYSFLDCWGSSSVDFPRL